MGDSEQVTTETPVESTTEQQRPEPPRETPPAAEEKSGEKRENQQKSGEKRPEKRENQQRGGSPGGGQQAQGRPQQQQQGGRGDRGPRGDQRGPGERSDRGDRGDKGDRGGDRGPRGERRFEGPPDIELEKLINDSLYLDNQAHAIVSRMRDMDSGTKSQLRRFYNAVRRATRSPENERQHEFVMLRARLAYTIARHSLRSLDGIERLLLQVTRKNEARGYERFRDLFEAIVAYNE
jgi:CRISPR type III-A-associated protein Csm2